MIPQSIETAFNQQIKHELDSAYLYLAMAAWFDNEGLNGMARWMRAQTQEEITHAVRFLKHIQDRGGQVRLFGLAEPPARWDSPLAAFEAAYKHEQFITDCIDKLARLARDENDFASGSLLQWFVDEQVEEEETALGIVQKLRLVAGDGRGLLMLDNELGTRVFTLAPELAAFYAQGAAGA